MRRFIPLIGLLAAMSGCAATDVPTATTNQPPSLSPQALPAVEEGGVFWDELVRVSKEQGLSAADCRAALLTGEAWWQELRDNAQLLFHEDIAPDEDTIRIWTVARRHFFERWLGTPQPVLSLRNGELQLSEPTAEAFGTWSRCARDDEAEALWRRRSSLN